ncbi:PTS glucitol/sorbitol transporter subunit IIA [Enterococcus hirae]|uniref:PTS glucitol/sorbitol transporter subunit IIA n=1 Tax=Enterococcus hirae TaxID=1354 RepID=UPI001CF4B0D6|nr:PTS glucitol/sorbitol transporter subunit IIA [Enterococcus hirae]MCA6766287.1 PTS glucitol/sorbitol transporter subunit IIA [Enterococcus hirae]
MHTTKIVEVGSLVEEFAAEYLMILFGQQVPPELKDICVVHDNHETAKNVIKTGDILIIGNQEYEIKEVGSEANHNFETLGHISIYFRTGENEVLPGAIVVEPQIFPEFAIGDTIRFGESQ